MGRHPHAKGSMGQQPATARPARRSCHALMGRSRALGHKGMCTALPLLARQSGHRCRARELPGGNQARCLTAPASATGTWGQQSCCWRRASPWEKQTTPWKARSAPVRTWGHLSCHQTWQLLQAEVPHRHNTRPMRRDPQLCHRLHTRRGLAFRSPIWKSSSQPSLTTTGPAKLLESCRTSCWLYGWSGAQATCSGLRQSRQRSSPVPCKAAAREEQRQAREAPRTEPAPGDSAPSAAKPHATACLAVKAPRLGLHLMLQPRTQDGKGQWEKGVQLRAAPSRNRRGLLLPSNRSGSVSVGPPYGSLSFGMGGFRRSVLPPGSWPRESSQTQESWGRREERRGEER